MKPPETSATIALCRLPGPLTASHTSRLMVPFILCRPTTLKVRHIHHSTTVRSNLSFRPGIRAITIFHIDSINHELSTSLFFGRFRDLSKGGLETDISAQITLIFVVLLLGRILCSDHTAYQHEDEAHGYGGAYAYTYLMVRGSIGSGTHDQSDSTLVVIRQLSIAVLRRILSGRSSSPTRTSC